MNVVDEVIGFASDYVNNVSHRTTERNNKINQAYRQLFGVNVQTGCGTCIVEAVIKIIKSEKMAKCDYVLKPGVFFRGFNLKPLCKWTLTNELAEAYLRLDPGNAKYFSVIPKKAVRVEPKLEAKPERKPVSVISTEEAQTIVNETVTEILAPKKRRTKRKVKKDVE